jgi:hypothetical protein
LTTAEVNGSRNEDYLNAQATISAGGLNQTLATVAPEPQQRDERRSAYRRRSLIVWDARQSRGI